MTVGQHMFGVVLWSDTQENKAVIWCEDQGDLAFYRQPGEGEGVTLDAGDLVQFDMTVDRHFRFAHNPRLVAEGYHPGLADELTGLPGAPGAIDQRSRTRARPRDERREDRLSAQILPFRAPGSDRANRRAEQTAACPA